MQPICFLLVKFPLGTLTYNGSRASGICHVTWLSFCTTQRKARPHLIPPARPQTHFLFSPALKDLHPKNKTLLPPSCLQCFVPVARTQTYWWQRKGDVIKRLTTAAHFTASINMCTWVWDHKCRQKSGCWVGGLGHWFWLNLVPIYPKACRVICRDLMGCLSMLSMLRRYHKHACALRL